MKNFRMLKHIRLYLPILMITQLCFADVTDDLAKAEKFLTAKQYTQAEQVYLNVINQADPSKPEELESAFIARKKLPVVYLAMDQQSNAQIVVQQLLTKHANHERLPHAIHEIVEQAKELNKTLEAGQIYQNILTAQPKHLEAIWLKMGIAIANAHLEDDQAVDSVLQNIITEHITDERAAEVFGQTAWAYRKLKQYDKARRVNQYVVDNWPNKDRAIFSQQGIILCNLKLNDQEAADAATEQLFQKFAGDKNMALVSWYLINDYRNKKDWVRMRLFCDYILKNHPDDEKAIAAQQAQILASINQKDAIGVQTGLQNLFAKFSAHKDMPLVVYRTAGNLSRYDDVTAQQLYQYIIDNHPAHEYDPFAKVRLAQVKFRLGDDSAAEAIFTRVLTQYKDHPVLPRAIELIAEGYWERAHLEPKEDRKINEQAKVYFQKAITKFETIITEFPDIPFTTPEAYRLVGECYFQLGQYDKTIEYCQTAIDNWPDYIYGWKALFRIVKTNKKLLEAGIISESEADAKITASYERIVKQFPDCPSVSVAQKGLNYYLKKSSKEEN